MVTRSIVPRSIERTNDKIRPLRQPAMMLAAGIGAISAAVASARRLSPNDFEALLVLGAIALSGSIAWRIVRTPVALDRVRLSQMTIVLASLSLGAAVLGLVGDDLPWALLLFALVAGLRGRPAWALPAAGATILPAIAVGARITAAAPPETLWSFLAAASATLCMARAVEATIDGTSWAGALLFGGAAAVAVGASIDPSPSATPIAFSLIAASMLLASETQVHAVPSIDPDATIAFGIVVAIAVGSAATVVMRDVPNPIGAAAVGVIVTGTIGTGWLGWQSTRTFARQGERLATFSRFASVDELTGLANRREMQRRIEVELARARRYGHDLSLLMIDIDDFKNVNDRLGHRAGDQALRETADAIRSSIRSIDLAARYGGEEFLVVLPETGAHGAAVVAERIRRSTQNGTFGSTVSIGVSAWSPADSDSAAWIERADGALLRAKRQGKNRVVVADATRSCPDGQF